MKPANARILTINGGSSSIKFALYQVGEPLKRGLYGKVDRIGLSGKNLAFHDPGEQCPRRAGHPQRRTGVSPGQPGHHRSGRARHANRGDVDSGLWGVYDTPRLELGAVAWFLVNDRVKLLAYRVFDPTAAPVLPKKPPDLTPQIAKRAYELYEKRGRRDGQSGRDWLEAEREIRKAEAKAEPKPEAKEKPKPHK